MEKIMTTSNHVHELANQANELTEDELNHVSGGKGGDAPVKYMEYKLKEVLISGVTPSL
jgi:bacteriocin-like protein